MLFYSNSVQVDPSLEKSMNLEKFGNSCKAQPNGSAPKIFLYYCGGVTTYLEYMTNQETEPKTLTPIGKILK